MPNPIMIAAIRERIPVVAKCFPGQKCLPPPNGKYPCARCFFCSLPNFAMVLGRNRYGSNVSTFDPHIEREL